MSEVRPDPRLIPSGDFAPSRVGRFWAVSHELRLPVLPYAPTPSWLVALCNPCLSGPSLLKRGDLGGGFLTNL